MVVTFDQERLHEEILLDKNRIDMGHLINNFSLIFCNILPSKLNPGIGNGSFFVQQIQSS
jgi:hypothetical protein